MPPPPAETLPPKPLYLFYGTQTDAILKARDAALNGLVPPDQRYDNVTEYYPGAEGVPGRGDKLELAALMGRIASDLSTMSFIAETPKCVIVTNPAEIFGGGAGGGDDAGEDESGDEDDGSPAGRSKRGKAAGGDPLLRWLEAELPGTGNAIILLAFEDEARFREVDDRRKPTPLFQLIQRIGYTRGFRDTKAIFRIEDAVSGRNLNALLEALRDLWQPGKSDSLIYNTLVKCVRFHLQANIARERKMSGAQAASAPLFPINPKLNLHKSADFVKRKYGAPTYRTPELLVAYDALLDVYRAMRPRPGQTHVPEALPLIEQAMARLIGSRRP